MSSRELRGLLDPRWNPVRDGLNTGRRQGRSDLTDPRMNSTSHNSEGIHPVEISSIRIPEDSAADRSMEIHGSFMETPIGSGAGTRQIITSEDSYEAESDRVKDDFEDLYAQVEKYGLEHVNTEGWKETIESEFKKCDDKLMRFITSMGLVGSDEVLMKVNSLRSALQNYRVDLWKRKRDDSRDPIFSRVGFSSRLAGIDDSGSSPDRSSESSTPEVTDHQVSNDYQQDQSVENQSNWRSRQSNILSRSLIDDVFTLHSNATPVSNTLRRPSTNLIDLVQPQEGITSTEASVGATDRVGASASVNSGEPMIVTATDQNAGSGPDSGGDPQISPETSDPLNDISLSDICKGLNWPDFVSNPELVQKIASFDLRIERMGSTISQVSKEAEISHRIVAQNRVQLLNQEQRLTSIAANVTVSAVEQQTIKNKVVGIQNSVESLDNLIASHNTGIDVLKSTVSTNNRSQEHAIKCLQESVSQISGIQSQVEDLVKSVDTNKKEHAAAIDSLKQSVAKFDDIKNQVESLSTVVSNNNSTNMTAFESVQRSVREVVDKSRATSVRIESLQFNVRDQKKRIQGIVETLGRPQSRVAAPTDHSHQTHQILSETSTLPLTGIDTVVTDHSVRVTSNQRPSPTRQANQSNATTVPSTLPREDTVTTGPNVSSLEATVPMHPLLDLTGSAVLDQENVQESLNLSEISPIGTAQKIVEHNIRSLVSQMEGRTKVNITKTSTELLIKESKNQGATSLEKIINTCYTSLTKYTTYHEINKELCEKATQAIEKSNKWIQNVNDLYIDSEMYSMDSAKSMAIDVEKFTGNGSQTIYEFLEDFDSMYRGKGSDKQKADRLYKAHLSERIKSSTRSISTDFIALKNWLLKEYGDYLCVTESMVSNLEAIAKPSIKDYAARADYFLKLESMLQKIEKLKDNKEVDSVLLKNHVYSQPFMKRIIALLPTEDMIEYTKIIGNSGYDTRRIMGEAPYTHLVTYCKNEGAAMETAAVRQSSTRNTEKTKGRAVHAAAKGFSESGSDDEVGTVHGVQKRKETRKITIERDWANPKWKFPCPLDKHDHEVASCVEFFALTSQERRSATIKRQCWTCFGPKQKCTRQDKTSQKFSCSNIQRVKPLVCKSCTSYLKDKDLRHSPPNVLFCPRNEHAKPTSSELANMLKDYFPSLDVSKVSPILVACVGANEIPAVNAIASSSKTRHVDSEEDDVIIDSFTGEKAPAVPSALLSEQDIPPIYIMQWFMIGDSKCLCFFDTGANIHMIDGKMAEKEELKVVSQTPTTLKVVGGSELVTDYGKYKLNLGPNHDGKYHGLTCHGMSSVAGPIPEIDLKEVNKEVRDYIPGMAAEALPEYVGGSMVHLLLGIRDTVAQPIHVHTLPSGISVYRSQFTDMFGSNICYGGSHKSFKELRGEFGTNHAVLLINTLNDAKQSLLMATENTIRSFEHQFEPLPIYDDILGVESKRVHYSVDIGDEVHTEIFPTPLTVSDFEDAGCPTRKVEGHNLNLDEHAHVDSQAVHWCSVNKAMVPIARLREIIDQDDVGQEVSYRCPTCSKCVKCKESGKTQAVTLQESVEQDIIEKSVTVDKEKGKVFVDLPFLRDPVPFLTQKHKGPDNYKTAKQVYMQQCRKPDIHLQEMRKAHKELVDRGFMVRLSDLSPEAQEKITAAPFQHYYPWRTVEKADSVSTPIRMVVDPTMTGLNLILAKGENRLGKMNEILMRNRVKSHSWTSDISKMYNQLQLKESSYPYSLFLYHESLSAEIEPEKWVMLVAWYGVVPTGNQAVYSIEVTAASAPPRFDPAKAPLLKDRFVDDLAPGANSEKLREQQIELCRELLGTSGFSLKFVARSGHPPCEKASADGTSLKMLGYSWIPEQDLLSPGISELNFNKKVRGSKKPNSKPIVSKQDAYELLRDTTLTRKMIASKVAEIYDPIGIWEPLKLRLKLDLSELNSLGWEENLNDDGQNYWKDTLLQFVEIPKLFVDRCVIPANADLDKGARLICLSDAAEHAGGVAIYIGFHCTDGTISSRLLTSKSKLMNATIPRNELSAIMLMTEIAFITCKSLDNLVTEVLYVTDSTIALSWCHNLNKKLRLYVHSRVSSIRTMIEWTVGSKDELPLLSY